MNNSAIAVRYAKAFYNLSVERNQLNNSKEDIDSLILLYNNSREFSELIESPVIKNTDKIASLKIAIGNKINELTLNFIELIINNGRTSYFDDICVNFMNIYKKGMGFKSVKFITAVEMSNTVIDKLKLKLEAELSAKVELETAINPSIIGGFVLQVDDKQFDASIANKLHRIKSTFVEAEM